LIGAGTGIAQLDGFRLPLDFLLAPVVVVDDVEEWYFVLCDFASPAMGTAATPAATSSAKLVFFMRRTPELN